MLGTSADAARVIEGFALGSLDPAFPAASVVSNLYDVSSGAPQLVSLLPSGQPPACGVAKVGGAFDKIGTQASNWVSEDGERVLFPSSGDNCSASAQLYLRDIPAAQTKQISPAPVSGPACDAALIGTTADAVFFASRSRLVAEDVAPASCGLTPPDNDVYRYEIASGQLECVTCVVDGLTADVDGTDLYGVGLAEDGSRLYFASSSHLLPGTPPQGQKAIYRVDLEDGDLAYVAPSNQVGAIGEGVGISSNGRFLLFYSSRSALNPLGDASDNGATQQYYLYDDDERSLVCASCPPDGSQPLADASHELVFGDPGSPGINSLADDGTVAFLTTTALAGADQNTPGPSGDPVTGTDVYEFRDGRPLLVTDGLTSWPAEEALAPHTLSISASGHDVYFTAPARYTRDAIDAVPRLYDARIGGGIDFPPEPKPCPLEVCQGIPKGAPEEQEPSSANFKGNGNPIQLRNCAGPARATKRLARRAKRLRGAAKHSSDPRRARALRRKAARYAKGAKRRSAAVKRCRTANRNRRNAR